MALLECRQNQTFIYCQQSSSRKCLLTAARVLTSHHFCFEGVRFIFTVNSGPFRGAETLPLEWSFRLTLDVMSHTQPGIKVQDKEDRQSSLSCTDRVMSVSETMAADMGLLVYLHTYKINHCIFVL